MQNYTPLENQTFTAEFGWLVKKTKANKQMQIQMQWKHISSHPEVFCEKGILLKRHSQK